MISVITIADIIVAAILAIIVRNLYIKRLSALFETHTGNAVIWITAAVIGLVLVVAYNLLIRRTIKKTVKG